MNETTSTRVAPRGRLRRWAAAAGVTGAAILFPGASVGLAADDTPPLARMLVAAHSGQAIDVPGASRAAGTQLVQWPPHGRPNQTFRTLSFVTVDDVHLVILVSSETGHVLDVNGGTAEGASVVQNPWSGSASQVWWMAPFGDTGYALFVNMGSGKVASVAGASQANGAPLVQSTWHGGTNQLWTALAVIA